jgi:hypothetical protein
MIKWLLGIFDKINRRTDMQIFWPVCKETALSLDHAKAIFFMHVSNDTAWTEHYTEEELIEYVDKLV